MMDLRRTTIKGQTSQLRERIGQLKQESEGLSAQIVAKDKEVALIVDELDRVETMYKKKLLPVTRVIAMRREAARIEGELGALKSQLARTGGQVDEIELQIIGLEDTFRSEATKDLRETQGKLAELKERMIAAKDQLGRIEIRSPQNGIVHELNIHTVGGVVTPGELLMSLVPDRDELSVELKISPSDIDHVVAGTKAMVRLTAFNQRTTPELSAVVKRVAADVSHDKTSGQPYYVAKLTINPDALGKLKHIALVPGMPVEAFVDTGEHTVASYLVKPLSDQFKRAMREE